VSPRAAVQVFDKECVQAGGLCQISFLDASAEGYGNTTSMLRGLALVRKNDPIVFMEVCTGAVTCLLAIVLHVGCCAGGRWDCVCGGAVTWCMPEKLMADVALGSCLLVRSRLRSCRRGLPCPASHVLAQGSALSCQSCAVQQS
jgi:hypothetical protein